MTLEEWIAETEAERPERALWPSETDARRFRDVWCTGRERLESNAWNDEDAVAFWWLVKSNGSTVTVTERDEVLRGALVPPALATTLIEQTCLKQGIQPKVLTLHSDRGAPMTSKCTAQLLADLGVTRSLSRPQVSDDNPFSEAQFKTLKYHPGFPGRFTDIAAAIAFCRSFFPWYNTEHRHGGIAMLTPDDVHPGGAQRVLEQRERTLRLAWSKHPQRFVHGTPKPQPLPKEVWINPPDAAATTSPAQ